MLEVQAAFEQPLPATQPESRGDVQLLLIADPERHVPDREPAAEPLDREPLMVLDLGDADLVDRDDQDPLVECVRVLDLGPERERRGLLRTG